MAKQINKYEAVIFKDGQPTPIMVDIHNLPYDSFDVTNPINIMGNVDLGKSKNHAWPDLSAVIINGSLDCSDFPITAKTVLPLTFKKLVCKFSINDLGVLIGRLPMGVSQVVVRTALLNSVRKNKDGALDIARRFARAYPNITVTDEKQTLNDILMEIERVSAATAVTPQPSKPQTAKPEVATKTAEWLEGSELVAHCATASEKFASLSPDAQERHMRIARSAKVRLDLKTGQFKRPSDGATVQCVHVDCVPMLLDYILTCIAEQEESRAAKDASKTASKKSVAKPAAQPQKTQPSLFVGTSQVKPVKIKKYISKSAWTQIRSKCSCSVPELLRVLNDIDCININPASTMGNGVFYVENGVIRKSRTVKFKSARCLAQGFGKSDNRGRIVWGVSGNVFVCQKFFADHAINDEYQWYVRDLNLDLSTMDLGEFLYVPDLIKELSDTRTSADAVAAEPVAKTDIVPETAPVVTEPAVAEPAVTEPVVTEPSVAEVASPVEKKRRSRIRVNKAEYITRAKNGKTTPAKKTVIESAHSTPAASVAMPEIVEKTPRPRITRHKTELVVSAKPDDAVAQSVSAIESQPQWVDIGSMHHELLANIDSLFVRQNALMSLMMAENDTDKLLKMTAELQDILQKKQQYENALSKLDSINMTLQELQRECKQR
ncbi:MAG: hypothetical protein IKB49_01025 [Alphaproteobacteria bacterium]|nr:hypothetical protein [Alphaproteobacteria bacterium]